MNSVTKQITQFNKFNTNYILPFAYIGIGIGVYFMSKFYTRIRQTLCNKNKKNRKTNYKKLQDIKNELVRRQEQSE